MSKPNVARSVQAHSVGKFNYNNDIRKFQGQKLASEKRKKEQEVKRHKKSAMLRKYAKLCIKEGIQSDRVNTGPRKEVEDSGGKKTMKSKEKENTGNYKPFKKAEEYAAKVEQAHKEKEELRKLSMQEKENALKRREEKRKLLSKKTKKGQPLLGNHMKSILEKLQKERE
jgi:hypothetical protein